MVMKGQDLLVLLKLAVLEGDWSYARLARELGMSASEVHATIKRCLSSGLYNPLTKRPNLLALEEFLRHGLRYVFPAQPGATTQGLPTSYAAEPLRSKFLFSQSTAPVMAFPLGPALGPEIEPLYRSAPQAAVNDPKLYRLLALVDALRSGRARERKLAGDLLVGELQKAERIELGQ